jgi:hypothetical protein
MISRVKSNENLIMEWRARRSCGSVTESETRYVREGGGAYRVIKIVAVWMEKMLW